MRLIANGANGRPESVVSSAVAAIDLHFALSLLASSRSAAPFEASRPQFHQQRLRLLQIARVKAFSEPPVHRSQQVVRFAHLALVAPEACEAHGGAEFQQLRLLR